MGRNMLALVASQLVTTPVSMVVNAMLARSLGASNFGAIYLATTVLSLAFLFVEWGGQGQISAEVARDHGIAGRVFGTGILLRVALAIAMLLLVPRFGAWMGYDATVRLALLLCGFRFALTSLGALCSAILRGYEKLQWHAIGTVFGNLVDATFVIVTLLAGGGLAAALTAQVVAAALTVALQTSFVLKLRIGRLHADTGALHVLLTGGSTFLLLDVVLKLQPYIDAAFLSRLAPPEALGWYAAASRIAGVLVFPALTLNFAVYPTLARLWNDDRATYDSLVRLVLRAVVVLGVLAGTGTAVFSGLIVTIVFGARVYAPAAANLSILSGYVLLVYGSIVIAAALGAAHRQVKWALLQMFCLVVSVSLDPTLIPWAQTRFGNGGIGVCISVVIAETVMVAGGLRLLPPGVLNRSLARTLGRSVAAAAAMALAGVALMRFPPLAIGATVVAYGGVLWAQGEMDAESISLLRGIVSRKLQ